MERAKKRAAKTIASEAVIGARKLSMKNLPAGGISVGKSKTTADYRVHRNSSSASAAALANPKQVKEIEALCTNLSKSLENAAGKWNSKMRKAFKLSAALDARYVDWQAGMISDDYFMSKLQEISDSSIAVLPLSHGALAE